MTGMAWTTRGPVRVDALRKWRRLALVSWAALLVLLLLAARHAALDASKAAAAVECRPVALSVVAGDTDEHDALYVLDSCGEVRRGVVRGAYVLPAKPPAVGARP